MKWKNMFILLTNWVALVNELKRLEMGDNSQLL